MSSTRSTPVHRAIEVLGIRGALLAIDEADLVRVPLGALDDEATQDQLFHGFTRGEGRPRAKPPDAHVGGHLDENAGVIARPHRPGTPIAVLHVGAHTNASDG